MTLIPLNGRSSSLARQIPGSTLSSAHPVPSSPLHDALCVDFQTGGYTPAFVHPKFCHSCCRADAYDNLALRLFRRARRVQLGDKDYVWRSNGFVLTILLHCCSCLFTWLASTCSDGGLFKARLTFPQDYPYMPPTMRFTSDMWHPNSTSTPSSKWGLVLTG